ncbi:MAG: hypothetical protein AMXMBFR80_07720 [Dehalococcoidia bacterium]
MNRQIVLRPLTLALAAGLVLAALVIAVLATRLVTSNGDQRGPDSNPATGAQATQVSGFWATPVANRPRLSEAAAADALARHVKHRSWCDEFAFTADSPKVQTCTVGGYLLGICNGAPATFEEAWAPDASQPVFPAQWDAENSRWVIEARCSKDPASSGPFATVWLYEDRMELVGADSISIGILR